MNALLNLSPIARLLTMKDALDEARTALDPNRKQKVQALRSTFAKDYGVSESDVAIIATVCYDTEFAPRTTLRDMMCSASPRLWPIPDSLDIIGQCQWLVDCLAATGTCIRAEFTLGMNAASLREKLEEVITESIGVFDPTAAIEIIEFNRCDDGVGRLPVIFWMAMPQDGVLQFTIQGGSDAS